MTEDFRELFAKENIPFKLPIECGRSYLINGCELFFEEDGAVIRALPHYQGNRGFFHVFSGTGEVLLLKSCYEDFLRTVARGAEINEDAFGELSRLLQKAESLLKSPHEIWLLHIKGENYIVDLFPIENIPQEGPNIKIPRPLTAQEYAQSAEGYDDDKTLYSRSFFHTILPDTLSHNMGAFMSKFPDMLASFFLLFDAKVGSPSLKIIDGKAYVNFSAIQKGFKETRIDVTALAQQYMPWQKLFEDGKKAKPSLFLAFHISDEELTDYINETIVGLSSKGEYSFFEADYFAPTANLAMASLMLIFIFQEEWLYFAKLAKLSNQEALKIIYRSREGSVFVKGGTFNLPHDFDPATENCEVTLVPSATPMPVEKMFEGLPFTTKLFNKKKLSALLKRLHLLLDSRDKLLTAAGEYHKKIYTILKKHSEFIKNKKRFCDPADVFLFDMEDVRRLVNDTYYTNFEPMREYRSSLSHRTKAQIMPYEIYEADIPFAGLITEDQMFKELAKKEYTCKSINGKDISGEVGEGIFCARIFPLAKLAEFKKPEALITDIAPALSYVTEYALMHDIPLYYGIRHCELLLKGKKVSLSPGKIIINE